MRGIDDEKLQGEHEQFEQFVTELKLLVKDCGYPNSEEMVRDRIVFATNSPYVRDKLLSQGAELTLDKAIDIARSHELAKQQLKAIGSTKDHSHHNTVHTVNRKPRRPDIPQKLTGTGPQRTIAPPRGHVATVQGNIVPKT